MGIFKVTINERASGRALVIHLFPVLVGFLSLLLLLTFVALILSGMVGFRVGDLLLRSNPIADFQALWPGQPIASVAAYARQTPEGFVACLSNQSPEQNYVGLAVQFIYSAFDTLDKTIVCTHSARGGVFRNVTVSIADNRVQELELISDLLPEDSLLLYWGEPDAITRAGNSQRFYLHWVRDTYWATALVEPAQPGAIVRILTLTERK